MNKLFKLAIISLATVPAMASAQTYLYISGWNNGFPYTIDGQGGGGPFTGEILSGPNYAAQEGVAPYETFYCDSVSQEMYIGQVFQVTINNLNTGVKPSYDPWVIQNANSLANAWDAANSSMQGYTALTQTQIGESIQGVIWNLDGQIASGPITSNDAETQSFANYLLNATNTDGKYLSGYAQFSATINYSNGRTGTLGQSQIGAVPEPSAFLALGLPLVGFAARRRRLKR